MKKNLISEIFIFAITSRLNSKIICKIARPDLKLNSLFRLLLDFGEIERRDEIPFS